MDTDLKREHSSKEMRNSEKRNSDHIFMNNPHVNKGMHIRRNFCDGQGGSLISLYSKELIGEIAEGTKMAENGCHAADETEANRPDPMGCSFPCGLDWVTPSSRVFWSRQSVTSSHFKIDKY